MQTVHLLARALRVFTLDPELSAYLKANDPQALSQAVEALAAYERDVPDPIGDYAVRTPGQGRYLGRVHWTGVLAHAYGPNEEALGHADSKDQGIKLVEHASVAR